MNYSETIVVGGGPAGSSCAWQLMRHGRDVLLLDKTTFPRLKLCAGWVPQKVMELLEFSIEDYPHSILQLKTKMYFAPVPFPVLGGWAAPWRSDYSIRRIEFDDWLLKRSQATVLTHSVNQIEHQGDYYVIDGKFKCRYLVGAGGTGCPVRRLLFGKKRSTATQISTIEKEFEYPQREDTAHLFFRFHGLRGYAWYVPKANGYVNIGLAGTSQYFSKSETHIRKHFAWFLDDLVNRQLLDYKTRKALKPGGHGYYLFSKRGEIKQDNCFLIGDAAGLATKDLGEGIGPAIESGLMAADEILGGTTYVKSAINPFSLNPSLQWLQYVWS
jgi:flavin-dependent dehydrogenase